MRKAGERIRTADVQLGNPEVHNRPPKQLVDIGGYPLQMQSRGSGTPTVVLEAGVG